MAREGARMMLSVGPEEEFKDWKRRYLSFPEVLYMIVDGIRTGVRAGAREKESRAILKQRRGDKGNRRRPDGPS